MGIFEPVNEEPDPLVYDPNSIACAGCLLPTAYRQRVSICSRVLPLVSGTHLLTSKNPAAQIAA
jgi:hypothetical protein